MPSSQPYKNNYYSKKHKIQILVAVIIISSLAVLSLLLVTSNKDQEQIESTTIAETNEIPPGQPVETEKNPSESGMGRNRVEGDETTDTDQKSETGWNPAELDYSVNEPAVSRPKTETIETGPKNTREEWESDLDRQREKGFMVFEDVIRQCSETRDKINLLQSEYDSTCLGTTYDAFGNVIELANTGRCQQLRTSINLLKTEIKKNLDLAQYNARKSGVYPGQIREILDKYGFDIQ